MKQFLLVTLFIIIISCNFEPAIYSFKNITHSEKKIGFSVVSDQRFQVGLKTIVMLNKSIIFEKLLESNKLSEEINVDITKLPIYFLSQIADLLVKNDSIKLDIKIVDSKMNPLLSSEIYLLSPKSKLLSNIELNLENKDYSFDEESLFEEELKTMILDFYRFNKVFLNRIKGFDPVLSIKTARDKLQFGIRLPSDKSYKVWLEDIHKTKFKLKELNAEVKEKNESKLVYYSQDEKDFDGIMHLLIQDISTGLLFTFPIFKLDNTGPQLSLSLVGGEFLDFYHSKDENSGEGYVSISHGNWESGAIPLKIFVTGDVEKLYFNGELITFRKDKSKYHTVYLFTHVGINSYEVKAIDLRGNVSIDDYIIEAVSLRNNNTIIENNIENNIEIDN